MRCRRSYWGTSPPRDLSTKSTWRLTSVRLFPPLPVPALHVHFLSMTLILVLRTPPGAAALLEDGLAQCVEACESELGAEGARGRGGSSGGGAVSVGSVEVATKLVRLVANIVRCAGVASQLHMRATASVRAARYKLTDIVCARAGNKCKSRSASRRAPRDVREPRALDEAVHARLCGGGARGRMASFSHFLAGVIAAVTLKAVSPGRRRSWCSMPPLLLEISLTTVSRSPNPARRAGILSSWWSTRCPCVLVGLSVHAAFPVCPQHHAATTIVLRLAAVLCSGHTEAVAEAARALGNLSLHHEVRDPLLASTSDGTVGPASHSPLASIMCALSIYLQAREAICASSADEALCILVGHADPDVAHAATGTPYTKSIQWLSQPVVRANLPRASQQTCGLIILPPRCGHQPGV